MNIAIIHQAFYPDPAGAAKVLFELARELVSLGHQVTVITGDRLYSTGEPLAPIEVVDGIRIQRLPVPGGRRSIAHRFLGMLAFTRRTLQTLAETIDEYDIVVASTLPPFVAAPASKLARARGKAFSYVCHDIYPDILLRSGSFRRLFANLLRPLLERQTRTALANASSVVVLSESMERVVSAKLPSVRERIAIIPNFADLTKIRPLPQDNEWAKEHGLVGKRVVLYAGNMGISHNLEVLLRAAALVKDDDLYFLFVGSGHKRGLLEEQVRELGLSNVGFMPYQPEERLAELLSTAHVSVVALEPELEGLAVPSKLYSIMASGRPCLVLQPASSEIARIVSDHGVGFHAANEQEVLGVLEGLKDGERWTATGRQAYAVAVRHYSLSKVALLYEQVFREACARAGSGSPTRGKEPR